MARTGTMSAAPMIGSYPRGRMSEHVEESFAGADLYGAEYDGGDRFVGCSFVDADLTEIVTRGTVFEECDLSGARLNASRHEASAFLRCRFRRTSLFGAGLVACKLTGSTFESAVLRPLTVDGGDWSYVSLRRADLTGVGLARLRLDGTVIDPDQAVALASALGAVVEPS